MQKYQFKDEYGDKLTITPRPDGSLEVEIDVDMAPLVSTAVYLSDRQRQALTQWLHKLKF